MDDSWMDNVEPLLTALESLDIDPVEWAKDHDMSVFYEVVVGGSPPYYKPLVNRTSQIHFACGYLQATGNLTGLGWAEQIQQQLDKGEA